MSPMKDAVMPFVTIIVADTVVRNVVTLATLPPQLKHTLKIFARNSKTHKTNLQRKNLTTIDSMGIYTINGVEYLCHQ